MCYVFKWLYIASLPGFVHSTLGEVQDIVVGLWASEHLSDGSYPIFTLWNLLQHDPWPPPQQAHHPPPPPVHPSSCSLTPSMDTFLLYHIQKTPGRK